MSGYLQRLARRTIKPGESLQPILGSVFAPQPSAGGLESFSKEIVPPIRSATPSEDAPHVRSRSALDVPGVHAFETSAPDRRDRPAPASIQNPVPASIRSFTLLVPAPKEENATMFVSPSHPEGKDTPQGYAPVEVEQETAAKASPQQIADSRGREIAPAEVVAGLEFQKVVASLTRPANFAADERERGGARQAAPVRHEPDEIQIHIGRIEVIAAPPPTGPRPATQTRKPLSLAEYLQRHDRRAS